MTQNKPFTIELWDFLKTRKKYWLLPITIMLILAGIIIILSQNSVISSFIYAFG
ncbi:MAG: hypothetical protein COT90_01765 [Candidatus Diapherotrites archaeon CG10_big_fil_rev_8_21_14_0_10_31_34]|nr:MAG: hypothetical protein COT90_01765 [Candidatus Diapherotrites archaeon CG10_big_fil_rev_8_21_14_0_10_31_34]